MHKFWGANNTPVVLPTNPGKRQEGFLKCLCTLRTTFIGFFAVQTLWSVCFSSCETSEMESAHLLKMSALKQMKFATQILEGAK